ncbi:hypothetical protein OZ410_00765 [Robiginitalea sp. M366]|uniref:hypothetical protein n=1 Tax=Robiginitalea aestuariiviva TaxID=3036903 RepID=UPI00240DEC44|nr:hypothetical protein [Robiginitalea aestuariiviva]MDG1570829.1 hypothetical protein [Robiginitalea aestuariiviva]
MKTPQISLRRLALLGVAAFALVSCEKEAETTDLAETGESLDTAVLLQADESEWISEELVNLGEEVYEDEMSASGKGPAFAGLIPDCATVTTVRTETTVTRTVDFGEGCEMPNGNVLTGILTLEFARNPEAASRTFELSLADFTFNGIAVEGGAHVLRVLDNGQGNPQSEVQSGFAATWPDGQTATWNGNRTREWVEGFGSGFWGDNVFLITGSQSFTGPLGNTFSRTVLEPLRREASCRFLVSGVLEIQRNEATASLDFGDGSCDAFGELTRADGTVETVQLRRRMRP